LAVKGCPDRRARGEESLIVLDGSFVPDPMPFELVVYRPRGRPPVTVDEVDRIVDQLPHFTKEELGGNRVQWRYKNPETGVHFGIKYDPEQRHQAQFEWNDSPMSISMALGRPMYFGQEATPLIDMILKNLNLAVQDVQKTALYRQPAKLTAEQIRESWEKSNAEESSAILAADKRVTKATREKMDYFWGFTSAKAKLQESYGPDVLVPSMNLHRGRENAVKTSCIWPDTAKIALPEVDFVLVQRVQKSLLSKTSVSGVAVYARIAEVLKPRSEEKTDPVRHLFFNQAPDKALLRYLSEMKLYSIKSYPKVSPDEIVEISK